MIYDQTIISLFWTCTTQTYLTASVPLCNQTSSTLQSLIILANIYLNVQNVYLKSQSLWQSSNSLRVKLCNKYKKTVHHFGRIEVNKWRRPIHELIES